MNTLHKIMFRRTNLRGAEKATRQASPRTSARKFEDIMCILDMNSLQEKVFRRTNLRGAEKATRQTYHVSVNINKTTKQTPNTPMNTK
jgi:hypothetical protein